MNGAGVTLGNWRQHPWSGWAFSHVDQLIGTQTIAAGDSPLALPDGETLALEQVDCGGLSAAAICDRTYTDGLLVAHRGRVIARQYRGALTPTGRHLAFSISKSLTGLLAGILTACGRLDPDAPVTHYLPELAPCAYRQCRVRHLLDMTVALRFSEVYLDPGDMARYRVAMDWNPVGEQGCPGGLHDFLQTLPAADYPHGEIFHYASPNSDALGWVLERAGNAPLAQLFSELLWQPGGAAHDAWITVDRHGAARAAGGIGLTLDDLARVGELVRLDGVVNGRQAVPAGWLADMRRNGDAAAWARGDLTELFPAARYRSQWYLPEPERGETLLAIGIHGQWLYVDRQAQLTVAKFSSQPIAADDESDQLTLNLLRGLSRHVRSS